MNLSQKSIQELQGIIEKDYGKKITPEEASDLGWRLLRLAKLARGVLMRVEREKAQMTSNHPQDDKQTDS